MVGDGPWSNRTNPCARSSNMCHRLSACDLQMNKPIGASFWAFDQHRCNVRNSAALCGGLERQPVVKCIRARFSHRDFRVCPCAQVRYSGLRSTIISSRRIFGVRQFAYSSISSGEPSKVTPATSTRPDFGSTRAFRYCMAITSGTDAHLARNFSAAALRP